MNLNGARINAIESRLMETSRRLPAPSRWVGVLDHMSREGLEILLRLKQGGCRADAISAEETEVLRASIEAAIAARDEAARRERYRRAWFAWAYSAGVPFREADTGDREPIYMLPDHLDPG